MKILDNLKEINLNEVDFGQYYIRKENICFQVYSYSIRIIDLTFALKRGKEVKGVCIYGKYEEHREFMGKLDKVAELNGGLEEFTMKVLGDPGEIFKELEDVYNIGSRVMTKRGVDVYSPFYKQKDIKVPSKWKIGDIVKGILSGQISRGIINSIYTDGYYNDYLGDYGKGKLDLKDFCKKLVEEPSGWWCYFSKEENETFEIKVNCGHHNNNTVYFKLNKDKDMNILIDEKKSKSINN